MRLWHVAQWGNKAEGGDGYDTNCIVRAPSFEEAITLAESYFSARANLTWNDGKADVIILLGEDASPQEGAKIVVYIWEAPAFNNGRYESWHRDVTTNEWLDSKTG